jgi:hypothetical protein
VPGFSLSSRHQTCTVRFSFLWRGHFLAVIFSHLGGVNVDFLSGLHASEPVGKEPYDPRVRIGDWIRDEL